MDSTMPQPRDANGRFMRKDLLVKQPILPRIVAWISLAAVLGFYSYLMGLGKF